MHLIGLRHGQSAYNLLGLCNDDPARAVDLTADGVRQAAAAAARLAVEPIDRIYCSPLLRTRRTAGIVAAGRGLEPVIDGRLADIRSGCDGRPVADYLAAIASDPLHTRVNDGESLLDHQRRVNGFLDELQQQPLGVVLLVVHEETLRVIHARCDGLELAEVVGRHYANCEPYHWVLGQSAT